LSVPLLARCQGVVIERRLRGWEKPSDHVPVVATLDLP
jgi:exonuclease III